MKTVTFAYLMKRVGLKGVIRILKKDPDFHVYEYTYDHYYRYLKQKDYRKELEETYYRVTGRKLPDREHAITFNEKIHNLKFLGDMERKTICSDKYRVRPYIAEQIGEEYLIPLLGVWEKGEDIDFDLLPSGFVLKSNTGAGRTVVVENKEQTDRKKLIALADHWQAYPYGYDGMELQYLNIPRKIIAEQFIQEPGGGLHDYKFHCFNGIPGLIEYMGDRDLEKHTSHEVWCNMQFQKLNIIEKSEDPEFIRSLSIKKPENFETMVEIARILSRPFRYVRVDLYNIDGKIYFGELTFTPADGFDAWTDPTADAKLGSLLDLKGPGLSENELLEMVDNLFLMQE